MNERSTNNPVPMVTRLLLLLLLLLPLIWFSARAGFSSLLSTYSERSGDLAAADAAVRLSPGDPDAHAVRGAVLEVSDDLNGAIAEYTQAASLRPDDYAQWLSLARVRELNGDVPGAIAAARQAVPLAPWYAQPHWQLGNLLVRAGQRDEGFAELHLAGTSDPTLLPAIIDLAWQFSGGDTQIVTQTTAPQSPEAQKALADYFRKKGKVTEAIAMYAAAGSETELQRQQYLGELIAAKRFKDAYALWSVSHPGNPSNSDNAIGALIDPGFEQESNLDDPGFGWRTTNKASSISFSLDVANPREGRTSLRVEFKGDSDPAAPLISQLVLVAPNTHYQVHFAARTESIVSGGLPRVAVMDASDNQVLGPPVGLPQQTSNWLDYTIDFTPTATTTAIIISCQRDSCSKSPCPIFGRLWLDSFSLQKL